MDASRDTNYLIPPVDEFAAIAELESEIDQLERENAELLRFVRDVDTALKMQTTSRTVLLSLVARLKKMGLLDERA